MDTLPPPPSDERPEPGDFGPAPTRRRRWLWIALPLAALVLVAAVVILIIGPGGEPPARVRAAPSPSPSPTPIPLIAPQDVKARARPFKVTLTWTHPNLYENDGFEIRRNGEWIGSVERGATRFVDDDPVLGKERTYEISATTDDGRLSESISIDVTTPLPPLAEARVAGTFDIRGNVSSSYGINDYDDVSFGWRMKPACDTRACGFRLRDDLSDITMNFKRTGGIYTTSFSGRLGLACGDTPVTSSGTVELRVKKARLIRGEWRAIRLTGVMRHSEPQQLGCRSSGATLDLNGKLIRLAG